MNSSSNNSLTSDIARDNCLSSKLRRLKIQENVLSANVNKCFLQNAEEIDDKIIYDSDIKLKKYFSILKDKFREVKHLFEDITLKTNDQYMEKSDIDELKRDILELETKIRTVKQFLASELQNLRNEEVALTEKRETSETRSEERRINKRNVSQIKGFKEIVPSPVRVMIHSPFKCSEVQQFQDFMKKSINRYGGWKEYNHNIFVHIWNKYYRDNNMMIAVKSIEETFSYQDFIEEVLREIPGSSNDSIDSHSKWYSEYLHLKINQQKALNKWKENKRKTKPTRKALSLEIDESTIDGLKFPVNTKLCRKLNIGDDGNINHRRNCSSYDVFAEKTKKCNIIHRNEKSTLDGNKKNTSDDTTKESTGIFSTEDQNFGQKLDISRLLRPTKQWLIKQESKKETYDFNKGVETIAKLHIPTWRMNLSK